MECVGLLSSLQLIVNLMLVIDGGSGELILNGEDGWYKWWKVVITYIITGSLEDGGDEKRIRQMG